MPASGSRRPASACGFLQFRLYCGSLGTFVPCLNLFADSRLFELMLYGQGARAVPVWARVENWVRLWFGSDVRPENL